MNKTMTRSSEIDIDAWRERRVPRDVLRAMCFIMQYHEKHGMAPTWADIARHSGWPEDRTLWRPHMKRLRRYGVKYRLNQHRSTKISGTVAGYVKEAISGSSE